MKQLDNQYFDKALVHLKDVSINNLFARSVVEHKVTGKIWVDNPGDPKTFYIVHPYGMSLLFGETSNEQFNNSLKVYCLNINQVRDTYEWMQAFPGAWHHVLNDLFKNRLIRQSDNKANIEKGIVELNTRINFRFSHTEFRQLKKNTLLSDVKIARTDKLAFRNMKGSVIPSQFWNSEDDFLKNGIGFSLYYKDRLASTAYSSFIHDDKLELGIETIPEFRGKGFAEQVCLALIDYCVENNFEPVWACRYENTGSYKLAQKIGFEPTLKIPYYRLSK